MLYRILDLDEWIRYLEHATFGNLYMAGPPIKETSELLK
jgi:hypothetical protein